MENDNVYYEKIRDLIDWDNVRLALIEAYKRGLEDEEVGY